SILIAVLLASIVGAGTWMTVLYQRAERNLERATDAERHARAQTARAESEAETAQRATDFMVDLFEQADPQRSGVEPVTARQLLDRGAARVEPELTKEPLLQAAMFETIAQGYTRLALWQRAAELFERALTIRRAKQGPSHADVARTLLSLGAVRRQERD